MGSRRNDLQIVFALQWINKFSNHDDKSNMVGIYDIPATTLSWDCFKSYLLQHLGRIEDDVKVSYIDGDNREISIENQSQFLLALYFFRQRARVGEIVLLKMEPASVCKRANKQEKVSISHDVEVQATGDFNYASKTYQKDDKPPEWFQKYMKQLKSELIDEITLSVVQIMSKNNGSASSQCHHSRKCKSESYKRNRKPALFPGESNAQKEYRKSYKLETKLDHKLEKLEHKTLKIKLKKIALARSSDSDVGQTSSKSRPIGLPLTDSDLLMDAVTTNQNDKKTPHMAGGESYVQTWEVVNSGKLPWTDETELRYAWGSQALSAVNKRVKCPLLQPREVGIVSVVLNVPETPGNYECYWHFHHNGRRFGHWLGCHVIVDEIIRASAMKTDKSYGIDYIKNDLHTLPHHTPEKLIKLEDASEVCTDTSGEEKNFLCSESYIKQDKENFFLKQQSPNDELFLENSALALNVEKHMQQIRTNLDTLLCEPSKSTNCSDSDNQSIISIPDSNLSYNSDNANGYVIIGNEGSDEYKSTEQSGSFKGSDIEFINLREIADDMNNCSLQENKANLNISDAHVIENNIDDNIELSRPPQLENNTGFETPVDQKDVSKDDGFAYIYYDGKKMPMPKKYLAKNYLVTAEEAVTQNNLTETASLNFSMQNGMMRSDHSASENMMQSAHCSAMNTSFSDNSKNSTGEMTSSSYNRLFVFPQNCPGFEVVYPAYDLNGETNQLHHTTNQSNLWSNCSNANSDVLFCNEKCLACNQDIPKNSSTNKTGENQMNYSESENSGSSSHLLVQAESNVTNSTNNTQNFHIADPNSRATLDNGTVHILPETVVNGAAILASSAINTARNVFNMIIPVKREEGGRWENGHWVSTNPESEREQGLRILTEMGFLDRDLNATLLARYNDNVARVVYELV